MDRNQVVSLVLLIAILFGLALDGARAFGGAMQEDDNEEVQAPAQIAPTLIPVPMPSSSPSKWDAAFSIERRFV